MSILIKGMEMPTDCTKCRFCNDETRFCWATREFISGFGHPKFCPLEEVPSAQPETHEERTETHACDYISRQAAIDAFCSHCYVSRPETCSTIQNGDKWCEEVYAIINLPSAQPEIIRCKDCKLHGTNGHRLNCAMFCCTMPDDGFCSCGERREDG